MFPPLPVSFACGLFSVKPALAAHVKPGRRRRLLWRLQHAARGLGAGRPSRTSVPRGVRQDTPVADAAVVLAVHWRRGVAAQPRSNNLGSAADRCFRRTLRCTARKRSCAGARKQLGWWAYGRGQPLWALSCLEQDARNSMSPFANAAAAAPLVTGRPHAAGDGVFTAAQAAGVQVTAAATPDEVPGDEPEGFALPNRPAGFPAAARVIRLGAVQDDACGSQTEKV